MNSLEQQMALVDKLANLTREGRLDWRADEDGEPFAELGAYFINLKEGRNANGSTTYRVIIEDKEVKTVDAFDDEDIDATAGGKYYVLLKKTINMARRKAKGADQALDEILKRLDEI